jgi:hypothetical protein
MNPQMPALHPNMAEVFRQKATALAAGLEHDGQRDGARQVLRGFIDQIVIPSGNGLLQVVANLGAMLDASAGQKMPGRQAVGNVGCGGVQPAVLAAVERRSMKLGRKIRPHVTRRRRSQTSAAASRTKRSALLLTNSTGALNELQFSGRRASSALPPRTTALATSGGQKLNTTASKPSRITRSASSS